MKKYLALVLIICYGVSLSYAKDNSVKWIKGGTLGCSKLMFSPNNKYFLSINLFGTQVWSLEKQQIIKMLPCHIFGPNQYVFSKDSEKLFYCDSAKIKCWDIRNDSLLFSLSGHHKRVTSLAISNEGEKLLSCGDDSLIIIWDIKDKPSIRKVIKTKDYMWKINFAGNDSFIVAVSDKLVGVSYVNFYKIFKTNSGRLIHTFIGKDAWFSQYSDIIAFPHNENGNSIDTSGIRLYALTGKIIKTIPFPIKDQPGGFSLTNDAKSLVVNMVNPVKGDIYIYNVKSGKQINIIHGLFKQPILISNNNKYLVTGWDDPGFCIFDLKTGKAILKYNSIYTFTPHIRNIAISPNCRLVLTSNSIDEIKLWNLKYGRLIKDLVKHHGSVRKIISNSKNKLLISLAPKKIYAWNSETGKNVYNINFDNMDINDASFSHNGKYLATIASRTIYAYDTSYIDSVNVSVWYAQNGKLFKNIRFNKSSIPSCLNFTENDKELLIANADTIQKYEIYKGKLLKKIHFKTDWGVSISPNGNYIINFYNNKPGVFQLWNIAKNTTLFSVTARNKFLKLVSFSQNEEILVTMGQDDDTLKVWENPNGRLIKTIGMNVQKVSYGTVSPDGKYFAGGSINGSINIWDLKSGKIIQSYTEYLCPIGAISWSSDGKCVLAGYQDGTIISLNTNFNK